MTAPAAFVGYGLFLVSQSVLLAVVVGAGVLLLCWFLIGFYAPRSKSDE
jgi:NADH:ubiquinone oxidoreductase subunit 5 (subunit L)/multisubunit Na+/H+ antiporter MnhA subunit